MQLLEHQRGEIEAAQQHAEIVSTTLKAALRKASEGEMAEAASDISDALEDIRELEDARHLLVSAMRRARRSYPATRAKRRAG